MMKQYVSVEDYLAQFPQDRNATADTYR